MENPSDQKAINRMNCLFWGSLLLQFVALIAIGVGLVARGYHHHWGIWFTLAGWIVFFSGYVIRSWVRRWFYKRNEK